MAVIVPLFVISIALFLLALVAAVHDRRAWARRLAATVQPLPEAPPEALPHLEIGSLTLAGPARSLVREPCDEIPPALRAQTPAVLHPPEPRRAAIAAPASSGSHAGTTPQRQVSQLLRRPLPPPFPSQDRLRPLPRPSADRITDAVTTVVSARTLASRSAVRAKGTLPPRPRGPQRAASCWPVIQPARPSGPQRRRPGG